MAYGDILRKAIRLESQRKSAVRNYTQSINEYNEEIAEYKRIKHQLAILNIAINDYKDILNQVTEHSLHQIKDLANLAVGMIFYDRKYSVELLRDDKRNNNYLFFMLNEEKQFELDDGTYETKVIQTELKEETGGGVAVVMGLVIQIFYLLQHGLEPVLFLDEALSQISSDYLDTLKEFIDVIGKREGMKFVLITHDDRFLQIADKYYLVSNGKYYEFRNPKKKLISEEVETVEN